MMASINDAGGQSALARETFDRVFEMWWPPLQEKIQTILRTETPAREANLRSDRELLEEILLTSRSLYRSKTNDRNSEHVPAGLVSDLANIVDALLLENQNHISPSLNESVGQLIGMLIFLNKISLQSSDIAERADMFKKIQSDFPF